MDIKEIQKLALSRRIQWTNNCARQMVERDISRKDVVHCIMKGEIIEDYPNDFPYPSCLIFGYSEDGRTIHVVVGYDDEELYIITAYVPNIIKFEADLKTRRK